MMKLYNFRSLCIICSLLALLVDVCTNANIFETRIWGDTQPAEEGQFPYYVQVFGESSCGGSLIAPDVIMTAAHCLGKKPRKNLIGGNKKFWVLVGALYDDEEIGDAEWRKVKSIALHPKTSQKTLNGNGGDDFDYDIALLKVDKPYDVKNSPITFRFNMDNDLPSKGEDLTLCGMGRGNFPNDAGFNGTDDEGGYMDYLHFGIAPYKYTNKSCNRKRKNGVTMWNGAVTKRQLCWSETCLDKWGICPGKGDSGGPLVKIVGNVHTQVGIVSYGTDKGERPDIFVRTSSLCSWVKRKVCSKWKSMQQSEYLCSNSCG